MEREDSISVWLQYTTKCCLMYKNTPGLALPKNPEKRRKSLQGLYRKFVAAIHQCEV